MMSLNENTCTMCGTVTRWHDGEPPQFCDCQGAQMTDQEHAAAIETATKALNKAIGDAARDGLRVEVATIEHRQMRDQHPTPVLHVNALRKVKAAA